MAVDYWAFIRRVRVPAIRRYAEGIGLQLPGIDDSSDPKSVLAVLEQVARNDPKVWTVFQEVEQFQPRLARAALRSVLVQKHGMLATFDAMTVSNRECALWLAACDPALFELAVSALNTWSRLGGRSWDGYRIAFPNSRAIIPDFCDRTIATFEQGARAALDASKLAVPQGRIKAVPFERLHPTETSHSQRTVTQVTIYAEGPQESRDRISDANEIHSEVVRTIDEGAVILDSKLRTIEVVVQGGARVRRAMAEAFCKAFFAKDVELIRLISRDIDFSKFLRATVLPLKPSDPVEYAAVDEIRYSLPDSGGALITIERPFSAVDRTNIYSAARGWPEVSFPEDMRSWQIVAVRLRFLFKGDGKLSKPRVRTVDLKAPRRTNLREKSDSDHAVMSEPLERWAVFKGDPDVTDDD